MFSASPRICSGQSFVRNFQLRDQLHKLQGCTASGYRKPSQSQRKSLKRWAVNGGHTSILTPKATFSRGAFGSSSNGRNFFSFDDQPEQFDGISDVPARARTMAKIHISHNNVNNGYGKISSSSSSSSFSSSSHSARIRQILVNPEDDPSNYPFDSWERERAHIRRRAKLSLVKKDQFLKNYEKRAVQDEATAGVEYPSTKFQSRNVMGRKEERWLRWVKKYGVDGFSRDDGDDGADGDVDAVRDRNTNAKNKSKHQAAAMMMRDFEREGVGNDASSSSFSSSDSSIRFVDLDESIRSAQLSRLHSSPLRNHQQQEREAASRGHEMVVDEGEIAYAEAFTEKTTSPQGESHLTPEEVSIQYYNRRRQHQDARDFPESELSTGADPDQIDYDCSSQEEREKEKRTTRPFFEDGSRNPRDERIWELHDQLQRNKINQMKPQHEEVLEQSEQEDTNSGGSIGQTDDEFPRKAAAAAAATRTASRISPSSEVEFHQKRFDEILERAIVLFSPPHKDALTTSEISFALKRVDASFSAQSFGAPELIFLLRNSTFLMNWRGKWAFVRLFDAERDDVTIKLERYKYREAPSSDGIRSLPERNSVVNFWG